MRQISNCSPVKVQGLEVCVVPSPLLIMGCSGSINFLILLGCTAEELSTLRVVEISTEQKKKMQVF